MKNTSLNRSRFIVGIALVVAAAALFLFAKGEYATSGVIALAILGLVSIAISRQG